MITRDEFLDELAAAVPESADLVAEYLADNDELLIHPLMSDLLRMTVSTFETGCLDVTDRLLAFVDRCLREGDDDVVNGVGVSFVENFGAYPSESDARGALAAGPACRVRSIAKRTPMPLTVQVASIGAAEVHCCHGPNLRKRREARVAGLAGCAAEARRRTSGGNVARGSP